MSVVTGHPPVGNRSVDIEVTQESLPAADTAPEDDQEVVRLLYAGRIQEANVAFDRVLARHPVPTHRASVLVRRAVFAWRLNRVPLALELAAEGWTELGPTPEGPDAADALRHLAYLLSGVGNRREAVQTSRLSVEVARRTGDRRILAACLQGLASALNLHAIEGAPERAERRFAEARSVLAEGLTLASDGRLYRAMLGVYGRALAGAGDWDHAARVAALVLTLTAPIDDHWGAAMGHWVLALERRWRGELVASRKMAAQAVAHADTINDPSLLSRMSLDLADICAELGDRAGEAAALRRGLAAAQGGSETLREGLGQALLQRRIAVQAQRIAAAAQQEAVRDPLTGVANRLGLQRKAPGMLEVAVANGQVPWLLLVDVDHFKGVNDDAGHSVGDAVLRQIAQLARQECRQDDLVARWAGDEFVILLAGAPSGPGAAAGPVVAERVRRAVAGHDWTAVLGGSAGPTVSIGVTCGSGDFDTLFAAADVALYQAKRAGRNQISTHGPDGARWQSWTGTEETAESSQPTTQDDQSN